MTENSSTPSYHCSNTVLSNDESEIIASSPKKIYKIDRLKSCFFRTSHGGNHFDYVDALRGLAILGVIMVHTNQYGEIVGGIIGKIAGNGQMGVQLFFLASAFTLFLSMNNRTKNEKHPTRNFFIRRFFRIAPLYYIAIIYYLWQKGLEGQSFSGINILLEFVFLHGLHPGWINHLVPGGWSIAVEMMFYVMLPFLFHKITNISKAFNFLSIAIVVNFFLWSVLKDFSKTYGYFLSTWESYIYFYLPNQLPVFALGIIMFFIMIRHQSLKDISGKSLLLFGCILLGGLFTNKPVFSSPFIFGVGFVILALAISRHRFKLFVNPIIVYMGKLSFSMYLIHFAVLYWLEKFLFIDFLGNKPLNYGIRLSLVIILTVLISTFVYHCVEIPFQKVGKQIINKLENKKSKLYA